ncbi:TraB/GumN family protein [Pantoea cypripedii]|uniref:Conjugal transfer protein TraB n=1 Tax=Pantoea cypripedii TaxID=55209 RepID=A0A6B9G156_PANCY|nr:TraB/GumN family protein [Pantoea cypripedii]QGY28310.1 conjugal transfer protein TraB [Pantoea cypripedii]
MRRSLWQCVTQLISRLFPASYPWPAMDIQLGDRRLHLVGSIHMGSRDMQPLPARLLRLLAKADALIVEADITQGGSPFADGDELPPLADRLASATFSRLSTLCDELTLSITMFDHLPMWQIALMLQAQQAQRLGLRPQYGIDYQLLQAAKNVNKPVIELEGPDTQIALLKSLPDDGLPLLLDTLEHWHTNARLLQTMISWWLDAPPKQQPVALPTTFSNELNDTLMRNRNQHWRELMLALPPGRYVVAVGALHLYGDDNLPGLLKTR